MERLKLVDKVKMSTASSILASALLYIGLHIGAPSGTSPQDAYERDGVLWKYGVTSEAQQFIARYPFVNRHIDTNGGGMTYDTYWEVDGDQEEALLHEASHVFAKHLMNPDFCRSLDGQLKVTADQSQGFYHELYYGNGKDFGGLKGNCTEEFASISSYSMGVKDKLPVNLQPFYKTLYKWGKP